MRKRSSSTTEAPAQDSFLDIVANMVGILIILVMVMGMRAGEAPLEAARDATPPNLASLAETLQAESSLRAEVLQTAAETKQLGAEAAARKHYRDSLSLLKATLEKRVAEASDQIDAEAHAEFQIRRELARARASLETLRQQRARVESQPEETVVLENYPTPISRTVHGREMHFQVRDGRIVYVPLQELVDDLGSEVSRIRSAMMRNREFTDTLGPIDGFRMRYTFRRYDTSPEDAMQTGQMGATIRLEVAEFLPVAPEMGEPIDVAIRPGSDFRDRLARQDPARTTLTLWVYPDSFEPFRQLRELLHEQGFAVAARPLPEGVPISGSPNGQKSAAE